jgi:hypothetical protein
MLPTLVVLTRHNTDDLNTKEITEMENNFET